jgi:hypothetical protein
MKIIEISIYMKALIIKFPMAKFSMQLFNFVIIKVKLFNYRNLGDEIIHT